MIVPQNRLLFWVAAIGFPFTAVLAFGLPERAPVWAAPLAWAIPAGFLLLALCDAALALGRLDGVSVAGPEVVRFSKDREGGFALTVSLGGARLRRLRLGVPFPLEFSAPSCEFDVDLPAGAERSLVPLSCGPTQRGRYRLDAVHLETSSPLGFWAVRGKSKTDTELRVYPNLFQERRNLAALFLNRGGLGVHAQRLMGKGRDFEKLREYLPGDGFEDIHWKATAKRGHPVTKVYQVERTQEVYVVLDTSRLSARPAPDLDHAAHGAPGSTVLERFLTAALVMGVAAERQGDLFGLMTFSDRVQRFVRARNGKAHYGVCRDAIYTLEPRIADPDFEEAFSFIRLRLRRRALLVFLTNLDDPLLAERFAHNVRLIARHHLVMVNMVTPRGVGPLFDKEGVRTSDDIYARLAGHLQWHDLRELERTLHRQGASFRLVRDERLCPELVAQYLNVKQRQLL